MLFNEPKLLKSSSVPAGAALPLVSVLFNEPKLLKCRRQPNTRSSTIWSFSALQRAEIAEIAYDDIPRCDILEVSVLFNEPKLLKFGGLYVTLWRYCRFSALQRAEIAEIPTLRTRSRRRSGFSALQRAEIAEIEDFGGGLVALAGFQCSSTSRNC